MKRIPENLNKCKCLKGVSIEKRVMAMLFKDAIDKKALCKMEHNGLFYVRHKKGDYTLLERDREFDEKAVRKYKRDFKNGKIKSI